MMSSRFLGRRAVIATLHQKERLLEPLLRDTLGLALTRVEVDTDAFGTFTGDVPRPGTMRDAAMRKVAAALEADPQADFAVASEGSFGPDPSVPYVGSDLELVVLASRDGLVLEGSTRSFATNYGQRVARHADEVEAFAADHLFPSHGLCALACVDGARRPDVEMTKGITSRDHLLATCARHLDARGAVWLETDMRAHLNPSRGRVIVAAAEDLVTWAVSECPRCAKPGFRPTSRTPGLPCRDCGIPTPMTLRESWACGCGHQEERPPRHGQPSVGPESCPRCNP